MSNPNLVRKSATSTISGESSFTDIAAAIGGSGGGGGTGKNYITTGSTFDSTSTAGWSLTKATLDATTKVPNAAASGSATGLSIGTVGSGLQLSVSGYSLSLISTGSTLAGDMLLSDAITLDQEAQSSVQTFSFFYKVASGSGDFSGTSSNTLGVAIYAVNGSQIGWIQPAGAFNLVQSSGVGKASGTFQVPAGCTSVRLAVYFPNNTASTITVYLDDFILGPQVVQYGAPVTDWASAKTVPALVTSTGTNPVTSTSTCKYRRIGDSYEIQWYYQFSSTVGSGNYRFQLPDGLAIDAGKISHGFAAPTGVGRLYHASTSTNYNLATRYESGATTYITVTPDSVVAASVSNTVPVSILVNDEIWVTAIIPIAGPSSSVQMSNDTDTRVVAFGSTVIGSQTLSYGVSSVLSFSSQTDSHSGFSGGTTYTIPVSGWYDVSTYILLERALNPPVSIPNALWIEKVGSGILATVSAPDVTYSQKTGNNGTFSPPCSVNGVFYFNSGDQIRINATSYGQNSTGNVSVTVSQGRFNVRRLSGPSAIAATETVALKYKNTAGTTLGATATIPFATRVYDTHGAYNGTVFTAPISGTYLVNTSLGPNSVLLSTTQGQSITYKVTSTPEGLSAYQSGVFVRYGNGANTDAIMSASKMYKLNAGDTIEIQAASSVSVTLATATEVNTVQIVRVGN